MIKVMKYTFVVVLLWDFCLKGMESTIVWNTNSVKDNKSIGILHKYIEV